MEKQAAAVIPHPAQARPGEPHPDAPFETAGSRTPAPGPQPEPAPTRRDGPAANAEEDFLACLAENSSQLERLRNDRRRFLGEMAALRAENRWEDILALFHPVEEKVPELDGVGLAHALRAEIGFALGHLGRYEEAIALYTVCVEAEPSNFHYHAGLAYTAYDSLYAAKTRKVMLHPAERKSRIELAHRHFAAAQALRPDGVTNYYRQGMLFKQIQNKAEKALPLFERAVKNWRAYSDELRQARHQERKNFIKSLYQTASCLLEAGKPRPALHHLEECLREDAASNHLTELHKQFALGKVHFALGDTQAARRALEAAAAHAEPAEDDYVFELLARVHLAQNDTEGALAALNRVPGHRRRPYFRWTEADVLAARGDIDKACRILQEAAERDRRGCHKALIRLARLELRRRRYEESLAAARKACEFFQETYRNVFFDGLFWSAAALLRLRRPAEARTTLDELEELQPGYPNLARLRAMIEAEVGRPATAG